MNDSSDLNIFIKRACELGAIEAKIIDPASIVTAEWVRFKCQFGCGGYNSSLCCPPHSPTPDQTRKILDCYNRAVMFQCKVNGDPKKIAAALEREIFLNGYYKALGLGDGPCRLCDKCNLQKCIHSREARPSMEACGIDVYSSVRANGFHIQVVTDHSSDQNYYGTVLID